LIHALIVIHVLAATVWTGGHLVLATTILPRALRERDVVAVLRFESGYERIGMPALLVQVLSGFVLALHHRPDFADWVSFEDPVGTLLLVKLALLAATVGLALSARLRVLPGLDATGLRTLAWHVVPVTILSVLFVIVGVGIRTGGFAPA